MYPTNNTPSVIRCRLKRNEKNGFGFSVKPRGEAPILMVSELIKNGEAELSGLIRPGDIILKINDIDVSRCSYEYALQVLKAMPFHSYTSFVIRAPLGYTTRLETTFNPDGYPRTVRITERIYKTSLNQVLSPNVSDIPAINIDGPVQRESYPKLQSKEKQNNASLNSNESKCVEDKAENETW